MDFDFENMLETTFPASGSKIVSNFKSTNNQLRNYLYRTDRRHKNCYSYISKQNLTLCCLTKTIDGSPAIWFNGGDSFEHVVDVIE